ncbi:MAG TPA: hypothetical protein VLG44_07120 [Chlamydiales bacterium]|nr:hypothetical protein [Chlamydiales bacterium]
MEKTLFFGLETVAPWPEINAHGRILTEKNRHMTFLYIGKVNDESALLNPPIPSFLFSPFGKFDKVLFLPHKFPRTASWHAEWLEGENELISYREELIQWIKDLGFKADARPFLPHVTIARSPKHFKEWKENFSELPFYCSVIHLYESLGNSEYQSLWSYSFQPPFQEIEHTADVAYKVYGTSIPNLLMHAEEALFFQFPELMPFYLPPKEEKTLDDVVMTLNEIVTKADSEIGAPCKAVSFHGNIEKENNLLVWEMIIDV